MNRRSIAAIALLYLNFLTPLHGQECKDCGKRNVVLYDNEVKIPRPTEDKAIIKWWDYYWIAAGVRNYLADNDPTRDCISRLDGAFFTSKDSKNKGIKFGQEHANTPPPGEVPGNGHYLVYGVITGDTKPTLTLKVETARSRELVKSVVIDLPKGFDYLQTGRKAAAAVGPIYKTILDFEKKKRDKGEPFAINPRITLTPEEEQLNSGEKTIIGIVMKDCDGVYLKNRTIKLTTTAGTLARTSLKTDEKGEASVEFTAGSQSTKANILAEYTFREPPGGEPTVGGEATITVVHTLTLPEKFVVTFDMKLHSKDMHHQFESTVNVTYVRGKRSAKAYSNIANTLEAAGKVDYMMESASGAGKGWNSLDKVWVQAPVSQEGFGEPNATFEKTPSGMLLTMIGFAEAYDDRNPEYMNTWVFETLELCKFRFTAAESDQLDMVEKVKRVRVPQDIKPTNVDDCAGEFVLTFKGIQKESIDIKLRQLQRGKEKK
jgi:hypothetical protein